MIGYTFRCYSQHGYELKEGYPGDGEGEDLKAASKETILPEEQKSIPTVMYVEFTPDFVLFVKTKSSSALTYLTVEAGVIESGYTGEICVIIRNVGYRTVHIEMLGIGQVISKKVKRWHNLWRYRFRCTQLYGQITLSFWRLRHFGHIKTCFGVYKFSLFRAGSLNTSL